MMLELLERRIEVAKKVKQEPELIEHMEAVFEVLKVSANNCGTVMGLTWGSRHIQGCMLAFESTSALNTDIPDRTGRS